MHGKILVYGDNPLLLTTRRSVLEEAGYRVYTTTQFADAMLMIMSHQINVLLLCQSAQSDERSGGLKFVIMSFAGRDVPVGYAEVVEKLEGPSALLPTIRGILAFHAEPQSPLLN
jgi:CheY-like chemotaxis protein